MARSLELNLELATELTLALPGGGSSEPRGSKRAADDHIANEEKASSAAKAQVVGWPPVRSFRKNAMMAGKKAESGEAAGGIYVKVSMDGAPYLRKIDLKVYKGYKELLNALETMFKCFTIADLSGKDQSCNNKSSEYALTYEDKDGDWMLVGDVPFEMFISSCKKLRIMKGSEAKGLGSCL